MIMIVRNEGTGGARWTRVIVRVACGFITELRIVGAGGFVRWTSGGVIVGVACRFLATATATIILVFARGQKVQIIQWDCTP